MRVFKVIVEPYLLGISNDQGHALRTYLMSLSDKVVGDPFVPEED
jgi:hypothetical protein